MVSHLSLLVPRPPSTYPIPVLGIYLAGEDQPYVKPLGPIGSCSFTGEIQPDGRPREPTLEGDGQVGDWHELGELYMDVLWKAL